METKPFWSAAPIPSYAALDRDIVVDVLVIGAGITGVTTAFLLQSEGLDVALVEREEIACGDTGHTTAHLTYMTDTRLSDLVLSTSLQAAGIAWHAGKTAMDFISDTVESQQIDAALAKVPGYLAVHAEDAVEEELTCMKRERDWCGQLGLPVHLDEHDPIRRLPALCFPDQMKFHPGKYLAGLVKRASMIGARIHENTRVSEFGGDHVVANGHRIVYDRVVIATHVPLQGDSGGLGAALFQAKLALYSTYAIAARLSKRSAEEMIWSDTADPFHYVRIDRHEEGDIVILGGCDHKTGQKEAGIDPYRVLEDRLADWFPGAVRTHRWSGQVVDARRAPFHRADGRTSIHRYRLFGKWNDLRHRRGPHGSRCDPRPGEPVGGVPGPVAEDREIARKLSRRKCGLSGAIDHRSVPRFRRVCRLRGAGPRPCRAGCGGACRRVPG
ncbi:MAG: FAD-binding oxidoreductase [Verrucomicrobiales bacterium]|nr:FAD-binding oxidoreductase [Verrucomicrobiales bacterium]